MNEQRNTPQPLALPFWRQLRWSLVLYAMLLAVIPLASVVTVTLSRTSAQAREQVVNQLESVAELKRDQIVRWLNEANSALDLILANPNPYTVGIYNRAGSDAARRSLQQTVSSQSLFTELFIYDSSGRIRVSSEEIQVGKVVSRQPYFASSLLSSHLQPPYYEVGTGELTMLITRPQFLPADDSALVMAARLNLDTLGDIMTERTGLGETGETYLVSVENNYLLTPSRFEDIPLTRAYHSEGIDRGLQGDDGAGTYLDYRNSPVIGVYRWIPELNAALLAEIKEAEAMNAFVQAGNFSFTMAFIAALVAVAVGLYGANQVSRPIAALTHVVTRIAGGDLTQRANVHTRNEIGVLAQSFNQMTGQLVHTIEEWRRATTLAQESARLKSEFVSTMSHELRTPLNAIIGFCGIMLEGMGGEIDEEAEHMVHRVDSNAQRLLNLINDLLDLAKIEAGRMELVWLPLSPRALAQQWESQMNVLAEQKQLAFPVVVDPALPDRLYGDQERITQVAVNLLSNALKFTEKGSVKLELLRDNQSWLIRVSDTGIGIPPHAINYIFDEFRQVDGSSKRVHGGSGLGLAIVRNLCRMMNGSVRVTSELGKGSVFTVTLPLVAAVVTEMPVLERV